MRLFFAVTLPDEVVSRVAAYQEDFRARVKDPGVRWTTPDQFHYTLKFLGELPAPRAQRAAEAAVALARGTAPFNVTVAGAGAFPSNDRPSTLWIGATDGAEELVDLARRLDAALGALKYPTERKELKAHLTLARIKSYAGEIAVARALHAQQPEPLGTTHVDRFVLMQSVLTPSGSEYTVVEEYPFTRED